MTGPVFLGAIGGFYAVLRIAHGLGDYWAQTPRQAAVKGTPGWVGRAACLAHVAGQLAVTGGALVGLAVVVPGPGLPCSPVRVVVALAVIGSTHYFADRRVSFRRLAVWVRRGRDSAWLDNGGLASMDQEWHRAWLLVAAVVLAGGLPAALAGG